ncbi:hypothetical protein MHYP_G00142950 [Metynnis hypsauchen]
MCIDLREPSKAIVPGSHPLPLIEDILSELHGSVMFSTLDLKRSYHQVPLHEDSRSLTAFITHDGLYHFCRIPYGLSSAPSAFQKMMTTVLSGLEGVQCYLDDVIVHGSSEANHNSSLHAVLHKINEAGLKLNKDKCKFWKTSLSFLGYRLSAEGLHPDEAHTAAILNAPSPTDATTSRSFLGLSAWSSKFIPAYATLVEPIRALLRKNNEFQWTDAAQVSFNAVKQAIEIALLCHSLTSTNRLYSRVMPPIMEKGSPSLCLGIREVVDMAVGKKIHPTRRPSSLYHTPYFKSKWPEIAFAPKVDTATVIQFLTTVFSREGNPKELVSDNGPQFSTTFSDFMKTRGILHLKSAVYYPRANREAERFSRVLKDCLQTASIQGNPWKSFTQAFLMDYRATPHATPSELLYGRRMKTKLQVMDLPAKKVGDSMVRQRVTIKQNKTKQYTDARRNAKPSKFKSGDLVRIRKSWAVRKGDQKFSQPRAVVEMKGMDSYLLDDGRIRNASRLLVCLI